MLICDISILNRYGKQSLDERLSHLDLDWHHLVVLLVLEQAPGITQARLSPFLQTDKANVTKLLQAMEQTGLLSRKADLTDHRSKTCWLDQKGATLVPELHRIMAEWEAYCFAGLSEEDLKTYEKISGRIVKNLVGYWTNGQ